MLELLRSRATSDTATPCACAGGHARTILAKHPPLPLSAFFLIFAAMQVSADFVYSRGALLPGHCLDLDPAGKVLALRPGRAERHLAGILSPAFVNAHCHLELSHLAGAIPKLTGMAGFIEALQGIRNDWEESERQAAISQAIAALADSGTGAIGDICNGPQSIAPKAAHPGLRYHNFCEVFSLDPRRADAVFEAALDLAATFPRPAHPTLHAPYSMSPRLRDLLCRQASAQEVPLSIHLLESQQERALFADLAGPLFDLFHKWGLAFSPSTYESPLDYVLEALPRDTAALLVHCTEMRPEEHARVLAGWLRAYFVLCPRANAYIHGTQPDAGMFAGAPERVCIGTDSLAGNDSLDMLEELKLLQAGQGISSALLLRWATENGAAALGLPLEEFSIAVGSRPRLILVSEVDGENANFTAESRARPLSLS